MANISGQWETGRLWPSGPYKLRLPVRRRRVVLMGAGFPVAITPGIIAELRRIFQLLLSDVGAETAERGIVLQGAPRHGVVAVAEAHEAAEADDAVGHAADILSIMRWSTSPMFLPAMSYTSVPSTSSLEISWWFGCWVADAMSVSPC